MGLDKLQEKAVVRIIDDDDSMRKSWRFLILTLRQDLMRASAKLKTTQSFLKMQTLPEA